MNDAYIIINSDNSVVFSPALLAEFPEISATVNGNVVTVNNVWREDLISVISDNVFWATEKNFDSFSIIFDNNVANVNELTNLIVRYVNFHNGDYTINTPKYLSSVDLIRDPLQLGIRLNYFGALQDYIDNSMTLTELSKAVRDMYSTLLPNSTIDETDIEAVFNGINASDMVRFLESNLMAMDTYNTVLDNSELGNSGLKEYSLTTAKKELVFTEDKGDIVIKKLCVRDGEDVSQIKQELLLTATEITQCVLESLTPEEFAGAVFTKVTTDFGVHANIYRGSTKSIKIYYDDNTIVSDTSELDGIVPNIWANFLIHLIEKSTKIGLAYIGVFSKYSTWGTSGSPRHRELGSYGTEYKRLNVQKETAPIFSLVKEYMDNHGIPFTIEIADVGSAILPENLLADVVYGMAYDNWEQFYVCDNIEKIYITNRGNIFDNGVFIAQSSSDFAVIGTPLQSKISLVEVRGQDEQYSLFSIAVENGFDNIKYVVTTGIEYSVSGSIGIGFDNAYSAQGAVQIINSGVTRVDKVHDDLDFSRIIGDNAVTVDYVEDDNLLFCDFCPIVPKGGSVFASNVPKDYTTFATHGLREVSINGHSILEKDEVLSVLTSEQPISIYSPYRIRVLDIELLVDVFNTLRNGYKSYFRLGSTTEHINNNDDSYAYDFLSYAYDVVMDTANKTLDNLSILAQGGTLTLSISYSQEAVRELSKIQFIDVPEISIGMTRNGFNRIVNSIGVGHRNYPEQGDFTVDLTNNDAVSFTKGDIAFIENAYGGAGATPQILLDVVKDGNTITFHVCSAYGGYLSYSALVMDIKTMVFRFDQYYKLETYNTQGENYEARPALAQTASNVTGNGNYIEYTFTENADGSVTVNYTAYDKDGNDITDQFNTLSLGDYYLHKDFNNE